MVFRHAQYGGREMIFEMTYNLSVVVHTIQAVFIGTNPQITVFTGQNTGDTGTADLVACSQFVTHVVETSGFGWVHIDSFLQQSQPNVTIVVLTDRIDFSRTEVDLTTIVRVVRQTTCLRVVNGQAQSIITNHDMVVFTGKERGDMFAACRINMLGIPVIVELKHAGIGRSYIDVTLFVFANVKY